MTDKDKKLDSLLENYFKRDCEEFSFREKAIPFKKRKTYMAVGLSLFCGIIILASVCSLIFQAAPQTAIYEEKEAMIPASLNNVALSTIGNHVFLLPKGEDGSAVRVGLIRMDRKDIYAYQVSSTSKDGEFVSCTGKVCEVQNVSPDLELINPAPTKEFNENIDEIIGEEFFHSPYYIGRPIGERIIYTDDGLLVGYYNDKKTSDEIKLYIVYFDGSTSTHYMKVEYNDNASDAEVISITLIKSEYSDTYDYNAPAAPTDADGNELFYDVYGRAHYLDTGAFVNPEDAENASSDQDVTHHGKLGLIRINRSDLLSCRATSQNDTRSFVRLYKDTFGKDEKIDLTLDNPDPLKTVSEEFIDEYTNGDSYIEEHNLMGKDSLTIGYYNTNKVDDILTVTLIYVDGSASVHHIKADYKDGAPVNVASDDELTFTLISSEYLDSCYDLDNSTN